MIRNMDDQAMTAVEIMTRIDKILGSRLRRLTESATGRIDEVVSQQIALMALARLSAGTLPQDLEDICRRRADALVDRLESAKARQGVVAMA